MAYKLPPIGQVYTPPGPEPLGFPPTPTPPKPSGTDIGFNPNYDPTQADFGAINVRPTGGIVPTGTPTGEIYRNPFRGGNGGDTRTPEQIEYDRLRIQQLRQQIGGGTAAERSQAEADLEYRRASTRKLLQGLDGAISAADAESNRLKERMGLLDDKLQRDIAAGNWREAARNRNERRQIANQQNVLQWHGQVLDVLGMFARNPLLFQTSVNQLPQLFGALGKPQQIGLESIGGEAGGEANVAAAVAGGVARGATRGVQLAQGTPLQGTAIGPSVGNEYINELAGPQPNPYRTESANIGPGGGPATRPTTMTPTPGANYVEQRLIPGTNRYEDVPVTQLSNTNAEYSVDAQGRPVQSNLADVPLNWDALMKASGNGTYPTLSSVPRDQWIPGPGGFSLPMGTRSNQPVPAQGVYGLAPQGLLSGTPLSSQYMGANTNLPGTPGAGWTLTPQGWIPPGGQTPQGGLPQLGGQTPTLQDFTNPDGSVDFAALQQWMAGLKSVAGFLPNKPRLNVGYGGRL